MVKLGVTGVPGTGKTTVSATFSERFGFELIEVNKIALEFKVDVYKDSDLIDIDKLQGKLSNILERESDIILEGHLLCNMSLPLDYLFVLRCSPDVLKARLVSKGWSMSKIMTNIEAEELDYCLINAEENYENIYQIDTTYKSPDEVVDEMISIMEGRSVGDVVDWSEHLFNRL